MSDVFEHHGSLEDPQSLDLSEMRYLLTRDAIERYVFIVEYMRSVGVLFARASSFVLVFLLLCSSRSATRTPAMLYVVFPTISISMLTCSR